MKKTNFFKLFLIGAVALTVGFTSCTNYVSEDDFQKLCEQVDGMQADITELRDMISPTGKVVADVVLNDAKTKLIVTYTDGSTPREITLPVGNDEGGALIPYVEKDAETGVYTLYVALKDDDEYTAVEIPTGGTAGATKIDILGWVEDYTVSDNLSAQLAEDGELIVDGVNANAADVLKGELYDLATDTFVVYYNVIDKYTGDNNGASQDAVTPVDPPLYNPYTGVATAGPNSPIYNAIAKAGHDFGTLPRALTTLGSQDKGLIVQGHGANLANTNFVLEDSQKNQLPISFEKPVLISGLLTRAAANSDLWFIEGKNDVLGTFKDDEAFASKFAPEALYTLVAPDGFRSEYTPFTITPTLVSSLEAQVIAVDEKEFQPEVGNVDASFYAPVGKENVFTFDKTYFFEDNAYTLYANDVRHTAEIGGADPYFTNTEENIIANGVEVQRYTNAVVDWYMEVGSNDELGDETYITSQFQITFNADHTTFTIGQLPDALTEASFWMDVYKLGIDGVVYYERVRIHPTRVDIVTEIDLGEYIVEDGFPGTTGNAATDYLGSVLPIPLDKMFSELQAIPDAPSSNMRERWQDDEYGAMTYTITNVTIEGHTDAQNAGKGFLGRFMFPNYVERGVAGALTTEYNGSTANTTAAANPGATENPVLGYNTYNTDTTDKYTTFGQSQYQAGPMASAFLAVGADGKYIPSAAPFRLFDARSFEVYPNYGYSDGVATTGVDRNGDGILETGDDPSFELGKKHTVSIDFFDQNGTKLNTIKVSFTPVTPPLNNLFEKEPEYWTADKTTLNAYYKTPDNWYNAKFYGLDATAAALDNTLDSQIAGPLAGDENMTYYNVYNPGGTTPLKHTSITPLDGGYNKIGLRTEEDKRWAATVDLALQDPDLEIDGETALGTLVNFLPQAAFGPGLINNMAGATSVIALYNQTNPWAAEGAGPDYQAPASNFDGLEKGAPNAYDKVLPMVWNLSPYIDFYKITGTEKFNLRVMSALDKGSVKAVAGAIVGDAAPADGKYLSLNDEHIQLENYNAQPFSIFKVWNATRTRGVYAYTYIYNVVFSRPDGVSTYDIMTVDATTDVWSQANEGGSAFEPTDKVESYLPLRPNNITEQANTKIHVKVYDRFGRTVEGDVAITLNVTALAQ